MSDLKYKKLILDFSLLLNEAQKPIQILDAIKWSDDVDEQVIKNNFKEMPKVDYRDKPLMYDPEKKIQQFKELRMKITRDLGATDPLGAILIRNCLQYEDVVRMLMNRGRSAFYDYSKKLYGSPTEILADGKTRLSELAEYLDNLLDNLNSNQLGEQYEKNLPAEEVVKDLSGRLKKYFLDEAIKVKLSDGIISDASAGADYIKIKKGMLFSKRDLDVFEVHEGWVHLGTTINGQEQQFAKWLSKGPPCSTITQEGLAVIMELFNFALYPQRVRRLNDRLLACQMAEDGANFLEVASFFRNRGQNDREAVRNAVRIFRGATLEGGAPFTKDITYLKGFVMIYSFMRSAMKQGRMDLIPFLFAGKVTLEDLPVLYNYHKEGVIALPKYLPPQIRDLNGLAIWFAFSGFLNQMKLEDILTQMEKANSPLKLTA